MKQQVIVIHGGEIFKNRKEFIKFLKKIDVDPKKKPYKDWKSTLQDKLGWRYEVIMPSMPNKLNARYNEWKLWFEKYFPFIRDDAIFIGHSLGGSFLTKYFTENKYKKRIKAFFFVATPVKKILSFTPKLGKSLGKWNDIDGVFVYQSMDDKIVRPKDALGVDGGVVRRFKNRGHFLQETLPELVKDIKNL